MFKKLLKATLPALFVFSFANVNDAKVEAANKKINVRVDYLEEGSNKKLAESAKLSGDENVFATISLPQNLAMNTIFQNAIFLMKAKVKSQLTRSMIKN